MKDSANDVSLTPADAARYLALSSSCLAKKRCYGGGPRFCKLGRRVTYRRSDLDAWREQNACSSTSEYQEPRCHLAVAAPGV